MKTLETPENYIQQSQLGNTGLLDDYDCIFPRRSSYFEKRKPIGFEFSKKTTQKVESPDLTLDVLDKVYSIPGALSDLVDEINDSKSMLALEENWDDFGAIPINPDLYKRAIDFLLMYVIHIYKQPQKIVIKSPEINPCANGTIDFSWRTNGARMLINVKSKDQKYKATFYGYHYSNKLPLEGLIDMENVDTYLALWMRELK